MIPEAVGTVRPVLVIATGLRDERSRPPSCIRAVFHASTDLALPFGFGFLLIWPAYAWRLLSVAGLRVLDGLGGAFGAAGGAVFTVKQPALDRAGFGAH